MEVSGRKVEIFCESCDDNGQKAVGFCVDCCEFLCCLCYQHHCRARAFRDHVLQDEKTMPGTKPDSATKKLVDNGDKCVKHQGEIIRFYCGADSQLGCGTCMTYNHRTCEEIISIEEEYEKFDKEIKDFGLQLDKNSQTKDQNGIEIDNYHSQAVKDIKLLMRDIKGYFENLENKILSDVDKVKEEDKKKMDSISATCVTLRKDLQSITSDLFKLHKTQQNGKLFRMIEEARNQIKTIAKDIIELSSNENKVVKYTFVSEKIIVDLIGNVAALRKLDFVREPKPNAKTKILDYSDKINNILHETGNTSTKSVNKTLKQTKSTAPRAAKRTVTNQATAKPEDTSFDNRSAQATSLENSTENNDATGMSNTEPPAINNQTSPVKPKLSTNLALSSTGNSSSSATRVTTDVQPYPFKPRKISQVSKITVESSTDKVIPSIRGIALLSDDQLVLVNSTYHKLKLFNIKQNTTVSELILSSNPWDITVVKNNLVATTMPAANEIQLVSVLNSNIFSQSQTIKVNGRCQGIVHNNGIFIVTFVKPGKIEMLSMSGKVLKVIDKGPNGESLFVLPYYIAISPDKTHVYISDMYNCSVNCMTLDGTVKGVYKDGTCYSGLTVEKSGSVYVLLEGYPNIIYQLSSDCSQGTVLQRSRPDDIFQSISYCQKEDKLYVGHEHSNYIEVFQLK